MLPEPLNKILMSLYELAFHIPEPPRQLRASISSPTAINISWENPADDPSIIGNELYVHATKGYHELRLSFRPPVTRYQVWGLTADREYQVQVATVTRWAEGQRTPAIYIKTPPPVW